MPTIVCEVAGWTEPRSVVFQASAPPVSDLEQHKGFTFENLGFTIENAGVAKESLGSAKENLGFTGEAQVFLWRT